MNIQVGNLPNEVLIEILLKTETAKDLMDICSTSKRIYNLCKSESVAKHIIQNLIRVNKPTVFGTYQGFLKHYLKRANTLHKDTIKFDTESFYRNFDSLVRQKAKSKSWTKNFEEKFGKLEL